MDSKTSLQQQIATMRLSLFDEDLLNEQFIQLEALEDNDHPKVIDNIIDLFLGGSPKDIDDVEQALEENPVDVAKLDFCVLKLKATSASICAKKLTIEIDTMLACCKEEDIEGTRAALPRLKEEFNTLKNRLEAYLGLLRQTELADSSTRPTSEGTSTSGDE